MPRTQIKIYKRFARSQVQVDFADNEELDYIDELICAQCSYTDPTHQFKARRNRGYAMHNTGVVKIYERKNNLFNIPTGLVSKVTKSLKSIGYNITESSHINYQLARHDYELSKDFQARPYQEDAIKHVVTQSRGIICCPTGSGKTVMAALLFASLESEKCVFFVHKQELFDQTLELFSTIFPNEEIGIIKSGRFIPGRITIAMIGTTYYAKKHIKDLRKRGEIDEEVDISREDAQMSEDVRVKIIEHIGNSEVVIVDECHHVKARTLYELLNSFNNLIHLYGMSATPKSKDGTDKLLWAVLEKVIYNLSLKTLVDGGWLLPPAVTYLPYDCKDDFIHVTCTECNHINTIPANMPSKAYRCEGCKRQREMTYSTVVVDLIDNNENLHKKIADKVWKFTAYDKIVAVAISHQTLGENLLKHIPQAVFLMSDKIEFGWQVKASLQRMGIRNPNRKDIFDLLRQRKIKCIITTLINEGVDIPALDVMVITEGKAEGQYKQRVGRVLRPDPKNKEKTCGIILDVFYENAIFIASHSKIRSNYGQAEGYIKWSG